MAVGTLYKQEAPHKACDYQNKADHGADVHLWGKLNANQGDNCPQNHRNNANGIMLRQGKIFQLFHGESLLT